jgi:hypothetical protein
MKQFLFIVFLVVVGRCAHAQVEGSIQTVAVPGADSVYYFAAEGWGAAPATQKQLWDHWPGTGATSRSAVLGEYPMANFTVKGWDGKFVDESGDTVYVAIITTRYGWATCARKIAHMNQIFATWNMDTAAMKSLNRIIISGFSGGGAEFARMFTNFCFDGGDPSTHRFRYRKFVTAATGTWPNYNGLDTFNTKCFYWGFHDDTDPTTSPANTDGVWDKFNDNPKTTSYSVKKSILAAVSHGDTDDTTYSFAGSTAANNVFRWAHDTADGLGLNCNLLLNRYYDYRHTMSLTGGGYQDSLVIPGPTPGTGTVDEAPFPAAKSPYQQASQVPGSLEWVYDFRGVWKLQNLKYYTFGADNTDSFFVYLGSEKTGWTRAAKIIVASGTNGWQDFNLPGTDTIKQYVKVVIHGTWNAGQSTVKPPGIRKLLFYGCPAGTVDTSAIPIYTKVKTRTPYKDRIKVNMKQGPVPMFQLAAYSGARVQNEEIWFDGSLEPNPDSVYYTPDFFNNIPGLESTHILGYGDSLRLNGIEMLDVSVRTSAYNYSVTGIFDDWPTDVIYGNIYDSNNYDRRARSIANKFALYGPYPSNSYNIRITGMPVVRGTNDIQKFGIGNEEDQFLGEDTATNYPGREVPLTYRYRSPKMLAISGQRMYNEMAQVGNPDGYFVSNTHVKNDSTQSKTLIEYSKQIRNDGKNIHKLLSWNNYPFRQVNGVVKGEHPVHYGVLEEFGAHTRAVYNADTSVRVMITETGYGRNPGSQGSCDKPAGKDSAEWQAEMNDWLVNEMFHAGIEAAYLYDLDGVSSDVENSLALFGTHHKIRRLGGGSYHYFPDYYFDRQRKNVIGNYYPDTVLQRSVNGVCVYVWQHVSDPAKRIYVIGKASKTGSTFTDASIPIGANTGTAKRITFSYSSDTPTEEIISTSGNNLIVSGGERLIYYEVTQRMAPSSIIRKRNRVMRSQ